MDEQKFLIYSVEHRAWWKKGNFGYTSHISLAGVFTYSEAIDICNKSNRVQVLNSSINATIEEMMVPVTEELASYLKSRP